MAHMRYKAYGKVRHYLYSDKILFTKRKISEVEGYGSFGSFKDTWRRNEIEDIESVDEARAVRMHDRRNA